MSWESGITHKRKRLDIPTKLFNLLLLEHYIVIVFHHIKTQEYHTTYFTKHTEFLLHAET